METGSSTAVTQSADLSGNIVNRKGKFHNGWTLEQEELMAKWADIATCYRWLHDRCEKLFYINNMAMTIPVIILSTLTGTASVGLNTFVGNDPIAQKYAQIGIGGVSLVAGILTTLGNFLRYAALSEANRVAGISWGKFGRQITVEISLHPNDRIDSMDFIKICRAELDRLIEQSPQIPDSIIKQFEREFRDLPNIKRPDICHGIEHTAPYKSNNERMKKLAAEASLFLLHKKKMMREEILPDIDIRLSKIIDGKIDALRTELATKPSQSQSQSQANDIKRQFTLVTEPDWRRIIGQKREPHLPHLQTPFLQNVVVTPSSNAPTSEAPVTVIIGDEEK
jgi:hypothetical protein